MHRLCSAAVIAALALGLAGCASTKLRNAWSPPDAAPLDFAGQKVLAAVIVANPSIRRPAETTLAQEITARGAQGVPAFSVLGGEVEEKDQEAVKAKLAAQGFAGAVVLRVVKVDQEITADPGYWGGPTYSSFYGYYGRGWGVAYAAPTVRTDTIASIETTVYSFKQDKMVFAALSETFNPSDVEKTAREIAYTVAYEMKKRGLINAKK